MTCVFDSIINALRLNINSRIFVSVLKTNNKRTTNVLWNGTALTPQQMDENYERIDNLNIDAIGSGYDCSTFDPVLFLVCELYTVDIKHTFIDTAITYKYKNSDTLICNRQLNFNSDRGHFWTSG